jgi:Zn-dependent metalloprotease
VTWFESKLTYQSEPGAINEALSDIFAASVERLAGGKTTDDTWLIGEDVALAGNPFRDMSGEWAHVSRTEPISQRQMRPSL